VKSLPRPQGAFIWERSVKAYANSHMDQLKEDLAPLTRRLPEPVQNFLDRGGWWGVLGLLGFIALLWLRWIVRKLVGSISRPARRKKKKPRMKSVTINLKENLSQIGEGYIEPGPQQVTVQGMPARLRLVILSLGTRNAGELSEEMADRVLDWIKPGLADPKTRPVRTRAGCDRGRRGWHGGFFHRRRSRGEPV
jgi:hypothetical protein